MLEKEKAALEEARAALEEQLHSAPSIETMEALEQEKTALQNANDALDKQLQSAPSLDTITQLMQEKHELQRQLTMSTKTNAVLCGNAQVICVCVFLVRAYVRVCVSVCVHVHVCVSCRSVAHMCGHTYIGMCEHVCMYEWIHRTHAFADQTVVT